MSVDVTIADWADFTPYLGKDDKLEVVCRAANGTVKKFYNCTLADPAVRQSQLAEKIVESVAGKISSDTGAKMGAIQKCVRKTNRNLEALTKLSQQSMDTLLGMSTQLGAVSEQLGGLEKATWLGNAISAANLVTTVAGFAIMSIKLDDISQQLAEISHNITQMKAIQIEFNIVSEFENLLLVAKKIQHREKTGEDTSRDEMEIHLEKFNLFMKSMLNLREQGAMDMEEVCTILYSLLPIYSSEFTLFLEKYYGDYVNGEHPLYKECQGIFARITDEKFIDDEMDYYYLEKGMHNFEVNNVMNQRFLLNCKMMMQISDTKKLLEVAGSTEVYAEMKRQIYEIVVRKATGLISELEGAFSREESTDIVKRNIVKAFGEDAGQYAEQYMSVACG